MNLQQRLCLLLQYPVKIANVMNSVKSETSLMNTFMGTIVSKEVNHQLEDNITITTSNNQSSEKPANGTNSPLIVPNASFTRHDWPCN